MLDKVQAQPESFRPLLCWSPTTLTADLVDSLFTICLFTITNLQLAAIEGVMKKLLFLSGETTLQIQKVKVLSISCIHQNIFSLEIDNALHLVICISVKDPPCNEHF